MLAMPPCASQPADNSAFTSIASSCTAFCTSRHTMLVTSLAITLYSAIREPPFETISVSEPHTLRFNDDPIESNHKTFALSTVGAVYDRALGPLAWESCAVIDRA